MLPVLTTIQRIVIIIIFLKVMNFLEMAKCKTWDVDLGFRPLCWGELGKAVLWDRQCKTFSEGRWGQRQGKIYKPRGQMPENQDPNQSMVEKVRESKIKQGSFGEHLQQSTQCLI